MVALQLANNETGIIQPIAEVAALVKAHRGILVVDAVQAVGRIPLSMESLGADFLILSSHKIGGPKGAGALVSAGEIMMPSPLVTGGGQEAGYRSGTENLAAIAGFGAAAEEALEEVGSYETAVGSMRNQVEEAMRAEAPDIVIHGERVPRLANTTFFSLPGLKAETAQIAFDLEGIALSAGSACSSGKVGPSHVLGAMGFDADLGALRVSIGRTTTGEEVDRFLAAFTRINRRRAAKAADAA
jgi:cysteine desulfurase